MRIFGMSPQLRLSKTAPTLSIRATSPSHSRPRVAQRRSLTKSRGPLQIGRVLTKSGYADKFGGPVPGLYHCGAGAHPGGGVTGAPGHNAAKAVLADRRKLRL